MTRQTIKNRINKILRETTSGSFTDNFWCPIHEAFDAIMEAGFEFELTGSRYVCHDDGIPYSKIWTFHIIIDGKKSIPGILTAHGAGTVSDPLSRYDISAYVS